MECQHDAISRNTCLDKFIVNSTFCPIMLYPDLIVMNVHMLPYTAAMLGQQKNLQVQTSRADGAY